MGYPNNVSYVKGLKAVRAKYPLQMGEFSSLTAKLGIVQTSVCNGVLKIYADDGGAAMTGNIRPLLVRTLLTVDHPGDLSVRSVGGQLKFKNGVDLTNGVSSAVEGYIEIAGTSNFGALALAACLQGVLEITTATTITAGGHLAGVAAQFKSDITPTGVCAGFVTKTHPNNTGKWPYGIYMFDGSVTTGIAIGTCTTGISIAGVTGNGIYITGVAGMALRINKTANTEGTMLVHCHQLADTVEVANDFKGEFLSTATGMTGINSEWTLDASSTAALIGINSNVYLGAGHSLTAAGSMAGLSAGVCITAGTINGANVILSGVIAGMVQDASGVLTQCKYMSALWASAMLDLGPASGGETQLLLLTNGGAPINQVMFISGIGAITKFLNLDSTITEGFVTVGAVAAGSPNVKLTCKFGTTTFYLQGYDS